MEWEYMELILTKRKTDSGREYWSAERRYRNNKFASGGDFPTNELDALNFLGKRNWEAWDINRTTDQINVLLKRKVSNISTSYY